MMRTIIPEEISTRDLHQFLLASVAPRPIAFVSTVDEQGRPNLAPYSFFNCFSSNPPILVFSSNRRVANNTTKDTLHNIYTTREAVINVVPYSIVRQMAICSIEFPTEVSEFEKSGLTPIASDLVRPFRVKESPVHMECKIKDIIALGKQGGAGHLIISHVVRMHIDEDIIDENNRINPHKIDLMGRLGRSYYTRVHGDSIQTIVQPVTRMAIGYDRLPASIRASNVLTGNDLARLAGIHQLPAKKDIDDLISKDNQLQKSMHTPQALHYYIGQLIAKDKVEYAAELAFNLADYTPKK